MENKNQGIKENKSFEAQAALKKKKPTLNLSIPLSRAPFLH